MSHNCKFTVDIEFTEYPNEQELFEAAMHIQALIATRYDQVVAGTPGIAIRDYQRRVTVESSATVGISPSSPGGEA